jgi:hypothetical protein
VTADDRSVERWLAEVRVEEAARERSRLADLRALDAGEGTLAGVLVDLAERGDVVVVALRTGRRHRGRVRLVGPDAAMLALDTGQWSVLRLRAIASVRTVTAGLVLGQGAPSSTSSFERLVTAVVEPGDLVVVAVGQDAVSGRVDAAGDDLVVLHLANGERAYASLRAADEVLLDSPPD